METKEMKPYGVLRTQGQKYFLLNPQPIPRDSCWQDGTYTFFVATWDGWHIPTHVITNNFAIEYDSKMPTIDVMEIQPGEGEPANLDADLMTVEEWLEQDIPAPDDYEEPWDYIVPDDALIDPDDY